MEVNINKKFTGFICLVPLVYFAGISLYSFLPEFFDFNAQYLKAAYWVNNTVFVASLAFIAAKIVVPRQPKYILYGTSIFALILGCFQIVYVFIDMPSFVWVLLFPAFIVPFFIIVRYVRS
jgi:hypothetical protein